MTGDRISRLGDEPARRDRLNRPRVTLTVPATVVNHFKRTGRGWKTRMVEALEREVGGD